ncbi:MAG: hypothetical protein KIC66_07030 [Clostridium sp.]|uniref:hypothetical protein n=1 Tax=Clostridium TaxID=1485 RepID=UPI000C087749|nr:MULTISPECIES: hypothetical protein [Clostridium]MBS5926824.1 hypothetical protein [Clostridium sp.]MDU1034207.1 hypothetical protein [Clostridium sp.]
MSLILSIISMFIVFFIINLLGKVDKEVCFKMLNKEKGVLALLILFFNVFLYVRYKGTSYYWFYYYLLIYLTVSAYIDYKIQKVYCFLNYTTMAVSLGLWGYQVLNGVDTIPGVTAYIFFVIISFIFKLTGAYAGGDNEVFIAIGYFIVALNTINPLIKLLLIMLMSSILLPILNFKYFSIKNMRFKEGNKIAFVPAIMLSTMINISL